MVSASNLPDAWEMVARCISGRDTELRTPGSVSTRWATADVTTTTDTVRITLTDLSEDTVYVEAPRPADNMAGLKGVLQAAPWRRGMVCTGELGPWAQLWEKFGSLRERVLDAVFPVTTAGRVIWNLQPFWAYAAALYTNFPAADGTYRTATQNSIQVQHNLKVIYKGVANLSASYVYDDTFVGVTELDGFVDVSSMVDFLIAQQGTYSWNAGSGLPDTGSGSWGGIAVGRLAAPREEMETLVEWEGIADGMTQDIIAAVDDLADALARAGKHDYALRDTQGRKVLSLATGDGRNLEARDGTATTAFRRLGRGIEAAFAGMHTLWTRAPKSIVALTMGLARRQRE